MENMSKQKANAVVELTTVNKNTSHKVEVNIKRKGVLC